jgi:hypothetical protein
MASEKPSEATGLGDAPSSPQDAHPVTRLDDAALNLRPVTVELCHRVRTAERAHFDAFCAIADGHKRAVPAELIALERQQQDELHQAVEALRVYCAQDPATAEAERVALMRMQVEGDLALAAQLRVVRDGQQRRGIRAETNERRAAIFESRDALSCGLGWPHRAERVVVAAWIYDSTKPDGKFTYEGEALYLHSYDTHNVSHIVRVEGLAVNRGELTLRWEPHERWGNADPDGDIDMRVAADPQRRLPHPLPRWPTESDVGEIDFRARIAVGEQLALL